jgi:hypothetical protein
VRYPTSGTRPIGAFTACLAEHLNSIVAYTGDGTGQTGEAITSTPRTTYVLDLASLHWRLGPAAPATVPPGIQQTQANLIYDRFNKKTYAVQVGSSSYQVWRFDQTETAV